MSVEKNKIRRIKYAMVGGKIGNTVGQKHREAIAMIDGADLVAGCFSRSDEENQNTGRKCHLDGDRVYRSYQEMAESESKRKDKPDFIAIVTPNDSHYEIAKCYLEKDFHIMCEKPLALTLEQAEELYAITLERKLIFGLMHTYSGYNMIKAAKQIIQDGVIGEIIDVKAEYLQNWLLPQVYSKNQEYPYWRMNPKEAGSSNCVGDIGTHVDQVIRYVTGLRLSGVSAVLDYYGNDLELNGNILVEFENGVHGSYMVSQVAEGYYDGLSFRIFGTKGAIEWHQSACNELKLTRYGRPTEILQRGMTGGIAKMRCRFATGQPEGLIHAFANNYAAFISSIEKSMIEKELDAIDEDYSHIEEGICGLRFIHAILKSNKSRRWVQV